MAVEPLNNRQILVQKPDAHVGVEKNHRFTSRPIVRWLSMSWMISSVERSSFQLPANFIIAAFCRVTLSSTTGAQVGIS